MESKEQLLMELPGLTARSLTHLTASMTTKLNRGGHRLA